MIGAVVRILAMVGEDLLTTTGAVRGALVLGRRSSTLLGRAHALHTSYRQTGSPQVPRLSSIGRLAKSVGSAPTKARLAGDTVIDYRMPKGFDPGPPTPNPTPPTPPPLPSKPSPGPVQPPPIPPREESPRPTPPNDPPPKEPTKERKEPEIQPKPGQDRSGGTGNAGGGGTSIPPYLPVAVPTSGAAEALGALTNKSQQLAGSYMPRITWTGEVKASGFKTTPTRTVLHYVLAVAFGLMRQVRIGSVALSVRVDYSTNTVYASYTSQTSMLTELASLAMFTFSGKVFSPNDLKNLAALANPALLGQAFDIRSILKGIITLDPSSGVADVIERNIDNASGMLDTFANVYQNVGRLLGPLAVWDMTLSNQIDRDKGKPINSDETIYGGLPSLFLNPPPNPDFNTTPQPFGQMIQRPLLTRNDAPNPQMPVPKAAQAGDAASGYSLDLRSLVAQALYDPGIIPPYPDTNVSLDPVYKL